MDISSRLLQSVAGSDSQQQQTAESEQGVQQPFGLVQEVDYAKVLADHMTP